MTEFFDKSGKPISMEAWVKAFADHAGRHVAHDVLPNKMLVSTVWLGLNHNFNRDGPPLIFETMVFASGADAKALDQTRSSTVEEARAGHAEMVAKWAKHETMVEPSKKETL